MSVCMSIYIKFVCVCACVCSVHTYTDVSSLVPCSHTTSGPGVVAHTISTVYISACIYRCMQYIHAERQTYRRQTERQAGRQTDRQTDRRTDGQTTHRHTNTNTQRLCASVSVSVSVSLSLSRSLSHNHPSTPRPYYPATAVARGACAVGSQ